MMYHDPNDGPLEELDRMEAKARSDAKDEIDMAIDAIQFWIRVSWFALISGLICGGMIGWGMRGCS